MKRQYVKDPDTSEMVDVTPYPRWRLMAVTWWNLIKATIGLLPRRST